jgi:hypothetical protein
MRDAARSAEILGRDDLAETLYRRANFGGGMCGTCSYSLQIAQIRGLVRVTEQARGCRAALAERLYAVDWGAGDVHGPAPLARAGFDVPRLYRAALLLTGREDQGALEAALRGLGARAPEALARLGRAGTEDWATRLRAIPGYADTVKGAALDRLLDLAERGSPASRTAALGALGSLAQDRGLDPCAPANFGFGTSHGSSGERSVQTVMYDCKTRLPAKTIDDAARRVEALASDPAPTVREATATALGHLANPRSSPVLRRLLQDDFDAGGQVCTSRSGQPEVCVRNRPVALAAERALEQMAEAEKRRAEQRAGQKKGARAAPGK